MKNDNRIIFHIDVNSAYLSWEATQRLKEGEKVDLRTIPSAIGGDENSRHGVVLARSVPSKKYNVKTGESLYIARKKCPKLKVVPARHHIYEKYSNRLMKLLEDYSPIVEKFSIDECFIDYTNMEMHFGPPEKAAYMIKERIKNELGFTVNIGISTNKLLAKMAGELEKPDLVHTLYKEEIQTKLWPLPVGELYMVGRVTKETLNEHGINTIGQLACTKKETIVKLLGKRGDTIWNYANGIESSPIRESGQSRPKGISNATTLSKDVVDIESAKKILLSLSENVGARLRQEECRATVVSVNLRSSDFVDYSKQITLSKSTSSTTHIYKLSCKLFKQVWKGEPLRQIGVSTSGLKYDFDIQLSLLDDNIEKQEKLDNLVDELRSKYGEDAVIRSSLIYKIDN